MSRYYVGITHNGPFMIGDPVFGFGSDIYAQISAVGDGWIEVEARPGQEGLYGRFEIGEAVWNDNDWERWAIVVPWQTTVRPYYLYNDIDGNTVVYHGQMWEKYHWEVPGWERTLSVGDQIWDDAIDDGFVEVTEVGPNWFKALPVAGGPPWDFVKFAAGEVADAWIAADDSYAQIQIYPRSETYFPENLGDITPLVPTGTAAAKYNVKILNLKGELFEVVDYDQPYRKDVKMKLLIRSQVE